MDGIMDMVGCSFAGTGPWSDGNEMIQQQKHEKWSKNVHKKDNKKYKNTTKT